jgi:signal transduction histidine kinase
VIGASPLTLATSSPRYTADRLAWHAARLARDNEALQDFVSLVAHDLRAALLSALRTDDPREYLAQALELVESILEAARADLAAATSATVRPCLDQALADLGEIRGEVAASVSGEIPLPPVALRVLLRNILANAMAAGATRIWISQYARGATEAVVVDDDGLGLSAEGYATGAGLGVALCRRLVGRFGGVLELEPRPGGGTRAAIVLTTVRR